MKAAWIVTSGEPLPTDPGGARLLRHGIVAAMLVERGWSVVWWTSNFDHTAKRGRQSGAAPVVYRVGPNYRIVLLPSAGYRRNVSLARVLDHRQVADAFTGAAPGEPAPDVVLCSYPTIELAAAATRFGQRHGVPVLLDVRDLWPDILGEVLPGPLKWLARPILWPYGRQGRRALCAATALTGITEPIVDWACRKAGRQRRSTERAFPLACTPPERPDVPAVRQAAQRWLERGVGADRFVVSFFGAMGEQFDFDTVLAAAQLLEHTYPQVLFVLCGQGRELERLQSHARTHANVMAPGWQGRADLHSLMYRSAAGLAPYFNEHSFTLSVPNKVIEYCSGGLPVLSSLRGETERLLASNDCGLTYAEQDGAALAACIRLLFDDASLRGQLGRNALRLFNERFTAERVYGELIEELGRLAAAAKAGA